ncbi:hypothetical protein FRB99_002743 [Tulasnella sp. 403]|nr:hypothetical protein FRB99_002743 [Tulasnella sp. 403]
MILAQLALLYICIRYRHTGTDEVTEPPTRPLAFWQWKLYAQYLEFLAAMIVVLTIAFLILGRMGWFVSSLGFFALGLESTLPLPQLYSNYRQKSLYGFRMSTLVGWVAGDSFKTAYFFFQGSPLQFRVCAIFQLTVDFAIVLQRVVYGNDAPRYVLDDEVEEALRLEDES